MDFKFYHVIESQTFAGQLLVPVRRLLRRITRPSLYRLRDLLQYLHDEHQTAAQEISTLKAEARMLRQEVTALRGQITELRLLAIDHSAMMRRVESVEDLLLRSFSERSEPPSTIRPAA
jgi:hypothetical protein